LSDIIYKYTDKSGAEKILSNRNLRFARPSEMNDPFDVYIDDLFGMDLKEFFEDSNDALIDLLSSNPSLYAKKLGVDLKEAEKVTNLLKNMSDAERSAIREEIKTADFGEFDPGFKEVRENLEKSRDIFVNQFKNYGIFCATKTYSNLLM
jgi:hypothetical protein